MKRAWILLLVARAASAQPAADAEALFRKGKELMTASKFAEACDAFEASNKVGPAVTTLMNLANCREKNMQLASAWALFLETERQTRVGIDDLSLKMHQVSLDRSNALAARLSKLTIAVPAGAAISVYRDKDLVEPAKWNSALPVDGGTYTIKATATGFEDWSKTVTIANEADAQTVEVPPLVAKPVAVTAPPKREEPLEVRPPSRTLPIILGASGIALLGGAIGFELWARSTYDDSLHTVDDAEQADLWHGANARRGVAIGMAIGAAGCAGVAAYFYVSGKPVTVRPLGRADTVGLAIDVPWW